MFSQTFKGIEVALDRLFCAHASLVSVVSDPMREYYELLSRSSVITVMNGYDKNQFKALDPELDLNREFGNDKIVVRYFGTITADRLMKPLWTALTKCNLNNTYRFEFYGDSLLLENYFSENGMKDAIDARFFKSIPYKEALKLMRTSDALLFTETSEVKHASQRGVLTTKLFEYMASCRPLIAIIDSDTVAGEIISQSGLAITLSIDELTIGNDLSLFPSPHSIHANTEFIQKFSRDNQFSILKEKIDAL
jgi:glycosyltransferase involved in cell wall biosynthesis